MKDKEYIEDSIKKNEELMSTLIEEVENKNRKDYYVRIRVSRKLYKILRECCEENETTMTKLILQALIYMTSNSIKKLVLLHDTYE